MKLDCTAREIVEAFEAQGHTVVREIADRPNGDSDRVCAYGMITSRGRIRAVMGDEAADRLPALEIDI